MTRENPILDKGSAPSSEFLNSDRLALVPSSLEDKQEVAGYSYPYP